MSRLKRFAHSLISGYVLLGANMIYTLASVPLALKYLSKAQFALWALATQVASYVALVDFGLGASASRVLIDHKDRRASGHYGSMVKTGALVGLTQGTLVILVGVVVALFIGPALRLDLALQHDFKWLMIGQCVMIGVGFYTRILNHLLTAHQTLRHLQLHFGHSVLKNNTCCHCSKIKNDPLILLTDDGMEGVCKCSKKIPIQDALTKRHQQQSLIQQHPSRRKRWQPKNSQQKILYSTMLVKHKMLGRKFITIKLKLLSI